MKKALFVLFFVGFTSIQAVPFTVTNDSDFAPGSFRIQAGNAGADAFNILDFDGDYTIAIEDPVIPLNSAFTIDFSTHDITFSGGTANPGLSITNGVTPTLTSSDNTSSLTINVNIGETLAPGGFIITDKANVEFSGVNTFTGGITIQVDELISQGSVILSNNQGLGTGNVLFAQGTLHLNDTITMANAIDLSVGIGARQINVAGGGSATVSGNMIGASSQTLYKLGNGTLFLTGVNTSSSPITISEGTLAYKDGGLSSSTGDVLINNTTSLDISAISASGTTVADLSAASGTTIVLGGKSLTFGTSSSTEIAAIVSGSGGSLVKIGDGTVTLSGVNTYTGGTSLDNGSLSLSNNAALGTGDLTMQSDTTLLFDGVTSLANNIIFNEAGTSSLNIGAGETATLDGIISGVGTFEKQNEGTLQLESANTYSGGTALTDGTIILNNNTAMGSGALTFTNGTLQVDGGITAGNTITLGSGTSRTISVLTGDIATLTGVISGPGSPPLIKSGEGTLNLSAVNTYTGATTISQGTLAYTGAGLPSATGDMLIQGTSTFNISAITSDQATVGNLTLSSGASLVLGSKSLTFGGDSDTNLEGVISGSGGSLIKTGDSVYTLSGTNTYTGGTTLNGGTLVLDNNSALGGGGALDMSDGTTLTLMNEIDASNNISITSQGTRSFNVDLVSTAVIDTGTLSGVISGAGSLEKTGEGTLVLSGENTYSGGTTISQGILEVSGSLFNTGSVTVNGSSSFDMSEVTSALTIGSLEAASGSTIELGTKSLTFGGSNNTTIAGVIEGDSGSSLTKIGTGSVTLSGVNTFDETMTVSGGTLIVNGTLPGSVTMGTSTTLKGTGTIGEEVSVASGASIRPGNSIGTITVGTLTLDTGSTTSIEFDDTSTSLIKVTGAADIAGTLHLIFDQGNYPLTGSYQILTGAPVIGTFSAITGDVTGFDFSLSYSTTDVLLLFTKVIPTAGLTGNILKFANYLNASAPASNEYSALTDLRGSAVAVGVNSASPARNAFSTYVTQMGVFSLSHIVDNYLSGKRFFNAHDAPGEITDISLSGKDLLAANKNWGYPEIEMNKPEHTLWASGFVDFARQDSESQNLPFDFISSGFILGLDSQSVFKDDVVGAAFGYVNSQVDDNGNMGSSSISSFAVSIYGDYFWEYFYFQGALWGVSHQINSNRKISYPGVQTKASSRFSGWQVAPHLEFGFTFGSSLFEVQPYASFDYVYNWEDSYEETGALNLNMRVKAQESSMLQTQIGMKFFQSTFISSGRFGMKEGISYINRTPFETGTITTSIFGATDFVSLRSFTESQNLGALDIEMFFQVGKEKNTTISLAYEGQYGDQYISNELILTLSHIF
ncbi:MAG: hypothetical protein SP4CHLAM5_03910 [Chlamydiia bacterium]|nr:hypothetical protein [Chlamydiia bacterium]